MTGGGTSDDDVFRRIAIRLSLHWIDHEEQAVIDFLSDIDEPILRWMVTGGIIAILGLASPDRRDAFVEKVITPALEAHGRAVSGLPERS